MYRLIDTHAHLENINDIEGAIGRASKVGIIAIVACGSDYGSNERILKLAEGIKLIKVYPTMGIHPWALKPSEVDLTLQQIEENIDRLVAVGEMGLDYWLKEVRKDVSARKRQMEVFQAQLDLAKRHDMPVIVHARGAWEDGFEMASEVGLGKVVFHWYSGPIEILSELIKKGWLISATPAVRYSKEHRKAILETPLENLLLETDSPVVYKDNGREYESEPADIVRTLEAVSAIKGIEAKEVSEKTFENGIRLFLLGLNR